VAPNITGGGWCTYILCIGSGSLGFKGLNLGKTHQAEVNRINSTKNHKNTSRSKAITKKAITKNDWFKNGNIPTNEISSNSLFHSGQWPNRSHFVTDSILFWFLPYYSVKYTAGMHQQVLKN